ncbi:MAG: type 4a pilus biogenesis protein PilO [Pseudomonadota bacterium]
MSVLDDLQALDINDIGRWPLGFRIAAIVLVFLLVSAGGVYMTIVKDKQVTLEREQGKEQELRGTFENKQRKAANYEEYKSQLVEMEQSFGAMLRQLPGETEIPNLIIDISQTGLAAGLEEKLFEPQDEIQKEFYAEKPIKIRLTGSYHAFANFASSVAALPRIVTLHDIKIVPESRGNLADPDELTLDVTAKTYRYLDEEG